MNWNGNKPTLDHLISVLQDPQKAASLRTEFNGKRRARVQQALSTRPYYQLLTFEMAAAGQTAAYRDTTQSLSFPLIIIGIKADRQTRDIVIRRTEDEKPIAYVGEELNLFLRLDEIAGQSVDSGGGQTGVFYLPQPIILPANNRLTVEMFKTDTTPDPEEANIVLVGVRVLNKAYGELLMDPAERAMVEDLIRMREVPRTVFLKQAVAFDSAVAGGEVRNLFTPQVEEPLLVRGLRTTLRHSLISMRINDEPNWMSEQIPVWGVAAEDDLGHDNYQWFARPIYLHSRSQIEVDRITNSIDGTLIDAQTGNSITWICETV